MTKRCFLTSIRVAAAVLILVVVPAGNAQATPFTDWATFLSSIDIAYAEDFQSLGSSTYVFTGPITMPTGLVVSSPTNELFAVGPGQSTNPTEAIGSNFPPQDYLAFDLGGEYLAFGADFFQNNGGGGQFGAPIDYQLQFFNQGVLVDTLVGSVAPNGGSFIGYASTLGSFNRVEVLALTSSFEVADNVTVGDAAAIPEPTSLLLLGTGLGALGLVAWRRKK